MSSISPANRASSSRRNSASLAPITVSSPLPSKIAKSAGLEDDYDYHDAGPSVSPTNPKQRSGASSFVDATDGPDRSELDVVLTNIYEKEFRSNRAKLPDDSPLVHDTPLIPSAQLNGSAGANNPSRKEKRRIWRISRLPVNEISPRSGEKTTVRKVNLHWSRQEGSKSEKILLNAHIAHNGPSTDSENSILWQHSNYENIQLKDLEDLLNNLQIYKLQESEIGLTKRLISRVRAVSERSFVGGSFLNLTAIRYDMLDDSRYNKDRCSIFLSFPYFSIKKPELKSNAYSKGAPEHPTRTLLQSRYRLNKTIKRDESQCISNLTGDKLKACIKAPDLDTAHLTRRKVDERVHVAQLWTLIIGLDRMITAGPIGEAALQGSNLEVRNTTTSGVAHKCSFVRIWFRNRGGEESQIYPISHCTSWFGLLNIHQQLRNVLNHAKDKTSPMDFKLRIGDHTLTSSTWTSVQKATDDEVLNIWMNTPKPPAVQVQDADGKSLAEKSILDRSDTGFLHGTIPTSTVTNRDHDELPTDPLVIPFLEWFVFDDFGNEDQSTSDVKTQRFLSAICYALPAKCAISSTAPPPQTVQTSQSGQDSDGGHAAPPVLTWSLGNTLQPGQVHSATMSRVSSAHSGQRPQTSQTSPVVQSSSGRSTILVAGKTAKDADDLTYLYMTQQHQQQGVVKDPIIEQRLRLETVRLFGYYVRTKHNDPLPPVRLFWGLLYELLEYRQHLHPLHEKVQAINQWAKKLHLGVYLQRRTYDNNGIEVFEASISDRAILQATMIDALGAVFNMFVAAVRESRLGHQNDPSVPPWQKALSYGDEACSLLEKARDKLIAEATGSAPGEDLGPIVMPEAIVITLLERLIQGVFGSGTVDIINIFEECLEQLAFDVERRPSRRLLKRINAFQEEVDIASGILYQQHTVLNEFRTCLDPTEFKRPTTARKMRFDFEKRGIERVLARVADQRRNCKELCDRAKVLENQNVRLVETLADDNSRAIFIFTFITILFLPLSFVATFFGMNVVGINPTTSTTSHFWAVGAPLTVGILVLCMIFVFRGEDVWFFFTDLPLNLARLLGVRREHDL